MQRVKERWKEMEGAIFTRELHTEQPTRGIVIIAAKMQTAKTPQGCTRSSQIHCSFPQHLRSGLCVR
jgi:hypothetical protein